MRTLVIGATGQLGQDVVAAFGDHEVSTAARRDAEHEVDLARPDSLSDCLEAVRPEIVINAAAAHNVPACEADPEEAYSVNATGVAALAEACQESGAKLIHVSTDEVYGETGVGADSDEAGIEKSTDGSVSEGARAGGGSSSVDSSVACDAVATGGGLRGRLPRWQAVALDGAADEGSPLNPTNPYAATKAAAEMLANSVRYHRIRAVLLVSRSLLGPLTFWRATNLVICPTAPERRGSRSLEGPASF